MACHWEDSDTVVQELFSNVGVISLGARDLLLTFSIRTL